MEDKDELEAYGCLGSVIHKLFLLINTYKKPIQALSVPSESLRNYSLGFSLRNLRYKAQKSKEYLYQSKWFEQT